jgi:uncharacterized SAM-binding protein YcdF (DUF218 family)
LPLAFLWCLLFGLFLFCHSTSPRFLIRPNSVCHLLKPKASKLRVARICADSSQGRSHRKGGLTII